MTKKRLIPVLGLLSAVSALTILATINVSAQDNSDQVIQASDPPEEGDGTMGTAASEAKNRGTLRLPADTALKEAADRAYARALRSGALRAPQPSELGAAGGASSPTAPAIVGVLNFAGQSGGTASTNVSPPDNEGAIGLTRYIQTINESVAIINRTTKATIGSGTLNQLAGNASTVNSFDPQIIWDPTTNRFYYAMDSIFSSTDNRLAFGFSKTASPSNVTTDWCHYYFKYGTPFPDYPKLGDSRFFMLIGVNVFANNSTGGFVGSDIVAISKPAAGSTCPSARTFKSGKKAALRDTSNNLVFTPVPSNQIDDNNTGYVVARNGGLPSTKLWVFNVTRNATSGGPVFGGARGVTVPSYTAPANASQPTFTQLIDTLDGRNTQAVQAVNPSRGTIQSFWTQHTIANGAVSMVRWYEINPAPATPVILRTGTLASRSSFIFNAAIAPDRKKNGATVAFGNSFVENHNASSPTISPRIVAGSSLNGAAVAFLNVKNGVGPYRDFTCQTAGSVCRWGDYAAMTPDPAPTVAGRGVVWGTNQFSGVVNPPPTGVNWRTQIFALQP
jgi:hypothetical protein